jgi:hypothetical protein
LPQISLNGNLRVAEAEADLDEAVAPQARADGQRHPLVDDLEMRHLQPLATAGKLAPGRQRGRAKLNAERRAGLDGRNDDDGSLDLEHGDLLDGHAWARPSGQSPGAGCFKRSKRFEVRCSWDGRAYSSLPARCHGAA